MTNPTVGSFLKIWTTGSAEPTISNMNYGTYCGIIAGSSGDDLNVTVTCVDIATGTAVNAVMYLQVSG